MAFPSNNKVKCLGTLTLTLICISATFNLRNLTMIAQYGIKSIIFYPIAALCFFVPVGLVCAELSSSWPNAGGMYVWIREAFGPRCGAFAIWLDWVVNLIWFPMVLSFMVGTLAYLIHPGLANDKVFMCSVMICILWLITFANFFGVNFSGRLSGVTALVGSIVPCLLLIVIGISYFMHNKNQAITNLIQPLNTHSIGQYTYFAGIILSFAGIEAGGLLAISTKDLKLHYPRAIFISILIVVSASLLGSLAIACVLSPKEINLISGFIETFQRYSDLTHASWLTAVIAMLTIIGSLSALNTWVAAPTRSLMIAGADNQLPRFLNHQNNKKTPTTLLLMQATLSTMLILIFLWMPTVNESYWLLSDLTAEITLVIYILLFVSAIQLRKTQPLIKRHFSIPGDKNGTYVICTIGILTCLTAIGLGFIPPEQLGLVSITTYECFLLGGLLLALCPVLFFGKKRNSSSLIKVNPIEIQ